MAAGRYSQKLDRAGSMTHRYLSLWQPWDGERSGRVVGWGAADGLSVMERPPAPLHQGPSANGMRAACPGTLTVGFVAVGGLHANEDVLVQQVLGVRDNGLQLQGEGHGIRADTLGTGR